MKRLTVLAVMALVLTTVSCGKKEAPVQAEPTATVSPFTPAGSGQVTAVQVKFWSKVNPALDSLAEASATSLQVKDSVEYLSAFELYKNSRETLCKQNGLSGGYKEYEWISKNISKAVNRPLLDSLKIKTL